MNLVISCNCKVIVLDPMTDLIDSMTLEQQAAFMKWQKGLVKSHNITFINISHTRKSASGQKAGSAGADLHEEDMFGNSAVYKSAACNLVFSRNKEALDEIEKNTTNISVSKHRSQGNTGRNVAKIYYSKEHSTLFSYNYAQENNFFKDVTPEDLKKTLDSNKATEIVREEIDDVEVYDVF